MALGDDSSGPVRYWVGPPPPAALTWLTRLLELATFLLVVVWVVYYLGGVGLHPTQVHPPSWRFPLRERCSCVLATGHVGTSPRLTLKLRITSSVALYFAAILMAMACGMPSVFFY